MEADSNFSPPPGPIRSRKCTSSLAAQGAPPLKLVFAAEKLEVRVEGPLLDHAFLGEVVELYEQQQSDHPADRQRLTAFLFV